MEDGEGECHVKHDSGKSWSNSHVEAHEAVSPVDLGEAVTEALVLRGLKTLHLSLHHIDWVVKHGGAETSEGSREEIDKNLVWNVVGQSLLGVLEDHEANTLVG